MRFAYEIAAHNALLREIRDRMSALSVEKMQEYNKRVMEEWERLSDERRSQYPALAPFIWLPGQYLDISTPHDQRHQNPEPKTPPPMPAAPTSGGFDGGGGEFGGGGASADFGLPGDNSGVA